MKINTFKKFLATGEMPRETDALDEAIAKYERETSDASLEDHDKRFHPGGYKDGDSCKFREELAKGDKADELVASSNTTVRSSSQELSPAEKAVEERLAKDRESMEKEIAANEKNPFADENDIRELKQWAADYAHGDFDEALKSTGHTKDEQGRIKKPQREWFERIFNENAKNMRENPESFFPRGNAWWEGDDDDDD